MSQKHRRPGDETEAPEITEIGRSLSHLPARSKLNVAELLRAVAALVEAAVPSPPVDDLMTAAEVLAEYGMGRAALDARGVPRARVGRAYRWRRSAVEAFIAAQPVAPRRKSRPMPLENEDPIDAMLRHGELRVTRGQR